MKRKLRPKNNEDKELVARARLIARDLRAAADLIETTAERLELAGQVDDRRRRRFALAVETAEEFLWSPLDSRPTEAVALKQAARASHLLDSAHRAIAQAMKLDPDADREQLITEAARVLELQERKLTRRDRVAASTATAKRWGEALGAWEPAREGAPDRAARVRRKANPASPTRWVLLGRLVGVAASTVKANLFKHE